MSQSISRRDLLRLSAASTLVASGAATAGAAPAVHTGRVRPVVVASANGHKYTNGGPRTCVETAFAAMTSGTDVLESLIAGVNLCELDPLDDSVGYGGLPNADGVVQLDACCMHGPLKRAGGVACLEGVRTPSRVAQAVMQNTDHHLLVGRDAQVFARQMGFAIEADLNTGHSRARWLEWKRRVDPSATSIRQSVRRRAWKRGFRWCGTACWTPSTCGHDQLQRRQRARRGLRRHHDQRPRLEDPRPRSAISPILGARALRGRVDRRGGPPPGAARPTCTACRRSDRRAHGGRCEPARRRHGGAARASAANTVEPRLLDEQGRPRFNVSFYVVNARGEYAGVSLKPNRFAVCTENGPRCSTPRLCWAEDPGKWRKKGKKGDVTLFR